MNKLLLAAVATLALTATAATAANADKYVDVDGECGVGEPEGHLVLNKGSFWLTETTYKRVTPLEPSWDGKGKYAEYDFTYDGDDEVAGRVGVKFIYMSDGKLKLEFSDGGYNWFKLCP